MTRLAGCILALLMVTGTARPMEFRTDKDYIYARGAVRAGDAGRLKQLLESRPARSSGEGEIMHLEGTSGSVTAAIALGRAIRDGEIETHIDRTSTCADACAIAFLGGLRLYATGIGVGRVIEAGATLEFSPIQPSAAAEDRSALGIVLDYARDMAGIDLGWLAVALTAAPGETTRVTRPRDFAALKLEVTGLPPSPPPGWWSWACKAFVARHAPTMDGMVRVTGESVPIRTMKDLRAQLAGGRLAGTLFGNVVARLNDRDAVAVVLGPDFSWRLKEPILEARRLELRRGAGLYYDVCLALKWKDGSSLVLVDENGPSMVIEPYVEQWMMRDPLERLWVTASPP